MTTIKSLQKAEKFEIEKFKSPKDVRSLSKNHVPYTGSPRKHPLDPEQIILVPDPYSEISPYLEFSKSDITYVEKLANIVNLSGETVSMARIWVKKGSIAVNCTPFQVASL
jgi:inorganic pyrophosphatase